MKRLPLFDKKNSKKIAEEKCHEIARSVTSCSRTTSDIGLMTGLAGISCFLFHYFKFTGNKRYRDLGFSALEKVVSTIDKGFKNPSFSGGLAGISWAFRYLGYMGFISREESLALDGLHPLFMTYARKEFQRGNYDFLHGALGMWMTTDPLPGEPDTTEYKSRRKEAEGIILGGISGSLRKERDGSACWFSPDTENIYAEVDMGMAHGIPSIISILSRIYDNSHNESIKTDIIKPGIRYILKQADENMLKGSVFPVSKSKNTSKYPSRMAWCYGDPGVALSVFNAGRTCEEIDWVKTAGRILLSASSRKSKNETKVNDSCLCHGSSGLSIIYYILWHYTGLEEFRKAAEYWAEISLHYGDIDRERSRFLFYRGNENYESHTSLLEGESGVGLSLLSMLEGEHPVWTRSLLLV